jgi:hypothetical protein
MANYVNIRSSLRPLVRGSAFLSGPSQVQPRPERARRRDDQQDPGDLIVREAHSEQDQQPVVTVFVGSPPLWLSAVAARNPAPAVRTIEVASRSAGFIGALSPRSP